MKRLFALSAIGRDRPGIVAALAKALFEQRCNLEDSSMTLLGDEFAVLLLVSSDAPLDEARLRAAAPGLTLIVHEASPAVRSPGLPHTAVVYGVDKPGIVYRVTQTLADFGASITDLRTHATSGLYSLALDVAVPDAIAAAHISEKLDALRAELSVEIHFQATETDEL